ncbi:MAG TPA: homoprotocatechuate degradation operon regulator HpaR [Candidatus Ignatzschineria merdigallinarum]|uniref:Homoprotocatechuate degradation operon regulator HpaR n=1 Tax=Candidatus Ignatzschineria merdigallinarum TaxID=2838621 RepID=A0A9D1Q785_9GAMM|nr:homoprotocatechuate degradation operon regulator HpaR [Candidatus Ignatzschineria merdigallinarum]
MTSTQKNIPLLLMRVRELMMRNFRPILTEWNLTEQQWRILRALYESKTLEPRELCDICCILSPSMAGILKRMEELNLIVKVPSKLDKRRVLVEIYPGVESMVKKILEANMKAYDAFAKQIGENLLIELEANLVSVLQKQAELEESMD